MKKALLLLVPLMTFADSSVKTDPFGKTIKDKDPFTSNTSPLRYPYDYTLRERIQIDKLTRQVRLYDRGILTSKKCSPSRHRAVTIRNKAYDKLRTIEPTVTKYNQLTKYSKKTATTPKPRPF